MERSDWVIDVGPGAGVHGGEIISAGSFRDLVAREDSATGDYLSGRRAGPHVPRVASRSRTKIAWSMVGAAQNNLKGSTSPSRSALFSVVTGVSGSGKSTLIDDILKKRAREALSRLAEAAGQAPTRSMGLDHFDKVIEIDQSPIGRTPRSNPATYTKVFDLIRDLFAQVPEAKARGWTRRGASPSTSTAVAARAARAPA